MKTENFPKNPFIEEHALDSKIEVPVRKQMFYVSRSIRLLSAEDRPQHD